MKNKRRKQNALEVCGHNRCRENPTTPLDTDEEHQHKEEVCRRWERTEGGSRTILSSSQWQQEIKGWGNERRSWRFSQERLWYHVLENPGENQTEWRSSRIKTAENWGHDVERRLHTEHGRKRQWGKPTEGETETQRQKADSSDSTRSRSAPRKKGTEEKRKKSLCKGLCKERLKSARGRVMVSHVNCF